MRVVSVAPKDGMNFLVVYLAAFGLVTLGSPLPRWIGYVAVVAGLAVLLSYLQFIAGAFMFVGLIGWILSIGWVVSTTVALSRPESRARLAPEMGTG
jgi:hypothetical protein